MAKGDIEPGEPRLPTEESFSPSIPTSKILSSKSQILSNCSKTSYLRVAQGCSRSTSNSFVQVSHPIIEASPSVAGAGSLLRFGSIDYPNLVSRTLITPYESPMCSDKLAIIQANTKSKPISIYQGKPSVRFLKSDKQKLLNNLRYVLVGKFSHGKPALFTVKQFFATLKLKGELNISIYDSRHLFFECVLFEDYVMIWLKLVWIIGGFPMRIFKWTEDFNPLRESVIAPVWISLPRLPLYLFDDEALVSIANAVGKPLKIDKANIQRNNLGCASICVELDLSATIMDEIWIEFVEEDMESGEVFWQKIVYNYMPSYCSNCYHLGHNLKECKRQYGNMWVKFGHKEGGYSKVHSTENLLVDEQGDNQVVVAASGQQRRLDNEEGKLASTEADRCFSFGKLTETLTNKETGPEDLFEQADVSVNIGVLQGENGTELHPIEFAGSGQNFLQVEQFEMKNMGVQLENFATESDFTDAGVLPVEIGSELQMIEGAGFGQTVMQLEQFERNNMGLHSPAVFLQETYISKDDKVIVVQEPFVELELPVLRDSNSTKQARWYDVGVQNAVLQEAVAMQDESCLQNRIQEHLKQSAAADPHKHAGETAAGEGAVGQPIAGQKMVTETAAGEGAVQRCAADGFTLRTNSRRIIKQHEQVGRASDGLRGGQVNSLNVGAASSAGRGTAMGVGAVTGAGTPRKLSSAAAEFTPGFKAKMQLEGMLINSLKIGTVPDCTKEKADNCQNRENKSIARVNTSNFRNIAGRIDYEKMRSFLRRPSRRDMDNPLLKQTSKSEPTSPSRSRKHTEYDSKLFLKSKPAKASKAKAVTDPNKPKRPPTAFFVFMEVFRQEYKAKHPNNKAVSVIGKAGLERWKSLTDKEKAPYIAKADKRKAVYEKSIQAYNKKLSEVEDEDDEDGSGEDEDDDGAGVGCNELLMVAF